MPQRGDMHPDVRARLDEVVLACRAIAGYVQDEDAPSDDVVVQAVRMRLVEIGEAVRTLPRAALTTEPDIPWSRIARFGERLIRRSPEVSPALVLDTARVDVPILLAAATRILDRS